MINKNDLDKIKFLSLLYKKYLEDNFISYFNKMNKIIISNVNGQIILKNSVLDNVSKYEFIQDKIIVEEKVRYNIDSNIAYSPYVPIFNTTTVGKL